MKDLDFSLIDNVEVVSLIALLDDDVGRVDIDGEHGVEDVGALVLVQVGEEDVLGNGLGQRLHRLVVLGNHFLDVVGRLLLRHRLRRDTAASRPRRHRTLPQHYKQKQLRYEQLSIIHGY